jgi:hypothetical protein
VPRSRPPDRPKVSRLRRPERRHQKPAEFCQSAQSLPLRPSWLCFAGSRHLLRGQAMMRFVRSLHRADHQFVRAVRLLRPDSVALLARFPDRSADPLSSFRRFRRLNGAWVRFATAAGPFCRSWLPVWQFVLRLFRRRRPGSTANTAVLGSFRAGAAVTDTSGQDHQTNYASVQPSM